MTATELLSIIETLAELHIIGLVRWERLAYAVEGRMTVAEMIGMLATLRQERKIRWIATGCASDNTAWEAQHSVNMEGERFCCCEMR